jgi:hypothetical protein
MGGAGLEPRLSLTLHHVAQNMKQPRGQASRSCSLTPEVYLGFPFPVITRHKFLIIRVEAASVCTQTIVGETWRWCPITCNVLRRIASSLRYLHSPNLADGELPTGALLTATHSHSLSPAGYETLFPISHCISCWLSTISSKSHNFLLTIPNKNL